METNLEKETEKIKEDIKEKYTFHGINLSLFDAYIDYYALSRGIHRSSENEYVFEFLSTTDQKLRETFAEKLIKRYWEIYHKSEFYEYFIDELMKTELGVKLFNKFQRDHVVHSAYVFLLGLFLFMRDKRIQKSFKNYDKYEENLEFFNKILFMWNIISTFHDVGYPFESFSREMVSYISEVNKLGIETTNYKKSSFKILLNNLDILSDNQSSFDVMKQLQKRRDANNNYLDLKQYFEYKLERGMIDHGILSSLFLLKTTDALYNTRGGDRPFFTENFPEIALAISLHNIDWAEVTNKKGNQEKDLPKITLRDFPFCYLLILADSLQEGDRPAIARPTIPSTGVSIIFDENKKRFNVKIALSTEEIKKINDRLHITISTDDGKTLPRISPAISNY